MTGPELAAIRKRLGLSQIAWGRALGYEGSDESVQVSVSRIERAEQVPGPVAKLSEMIERYGIPAST